MEEIKNLKDILTLIGMIFSFLGVYLVGINKFFIERMKTYFKHYPGEDSKLNMFINLFTVIIMVFDIVSILAGCVLMIAFICKNKLTSSNIINKVFITKSDVWSLILNCVLLLLLVIPLIMFIKVLKKYENTKVFYKWRLKGIVEVETEIYDILIKMLEKLRYLKFLKRRTSYLKAKRQEKIGKKKSDFISEKFIHRNYLFFKNMSRIYGLYSFILIVILLIGIYDSGLCIFVEGVLLEDFIMYMAYFLLCIGMLVFSNSMQLLYGGFENNYTYKLIKNNNNFIECKAYLEYKDYYLVVVNNVEKYIKKNEVKCIEKV